MLINRTQNDINNTTFIGSTNQTQVIDDFSRVDIQLDGAASTLNNTNMSGMSFGKIIEDIGVTNLIET
tara:strand:- start:72 stop:275 length:204 start_codon:yes stop_codon:yes gene_type:complete